MAYLSPEAKIEHALLARVATLSLNPSFAVAWPGQTFPPVGQPKPENYLRVEHDATAVTRPFLGSESSQRFAGFLFVSVCMSLGTSTTVARDIAGQVANHFPTDTDLEAEGVTLRIVKRPMAENGYRDATDERWRTPVAIEYEAWVRTS